MTSATAQGDMMTATIKRLQAENDALKTKVFIIHSAAGFVVDGADGRDYHLHGLERALQLNPNECLASVESKVIIEAMTATRTSFTIGGDPCLCPVAALEEYAANLITQAQEQDK